MAIKVKLADGTVEVGGEFKAALEFIKGQVGRKWDAASKTWSVPQAVEQFRKGCSFPLTLPGGDHVTRYGTRYERNEWACLQEESQAERAVARPYLDKTDEAMAEFRRKLEAAGLSERGIGIVVNYQGMLDAAERDGMIGFSSPARRSEIEAICQGWHAEMDRLTRDLDDATHAAKENIAKKYGF